MDHPGADLEVVVDALAHQAVRPVVEDHLALRDRLVGVAIELHPVGEQAGLAADDLHVADRDEQVGGAAHLLELVGDHGGFLAARAERRDAGLRPGRAGARTHDGPAENRTASRSPPGPDIERTGNRGADMRAHASSGLRQ